MRRANMPRRFWPDALLHWCRTYAKTNWRNRPIARFERTDGQWIGEQGEHSKTKTCGGIQKEFTAGVFKKSARIDPRARLKGRVTDNEFRSFVDSCLKANKSPGPDGYTNECVKTMSHAEREVIRAWANEMLALEKARVMTVEEMNGTISLLHKGGTTDDKPQDWRPVVLLNCTNQLIMHILNARLRSIVEKAGILEPGQSGGRQGRSTDINLAKLEWVTQEAVAQGKRVYRVDVDFCNAFNAMSQAALWAVMRAYGIPDVDLLVSLYEHSTVRMAPIY